MTAPRLVLDTNVLLSALLFRSAAMTWLRTAWQSGTFLPLVSSDTMAELSRVLSYPKFALSAQDCNDLLADYLPWCETIIIADPPPITPECRDPFDQPFLLLALAGNADALVTGDRDLLTLAGNFSVPILAPADMKIRLLG